MKPGKQPRVVVVGSSNTDFVIRSQRLPAPGQTVLGGDFAIHPGGKGANQAVAAARAGGRVSLVACIGVDPHGDAAFARLQAEGIHLDHVVRQAGRPSGVALILVDAGGENMISVARSSNDELGPGDVAAARRTIRSAGCLVLQLEVPLPAVEAAVRLAHEEGVRVVLNPAPAPLGGLPPPLLQGLFALTPNAQEAAELTGQRAGGGPKAVERAARRLVAAGVEHVLVTCGAAGVCWARRGALRWFPALPVEAVDTVGAGDCFTGTLAVALAERQPMDRAIGFALAAAALCVSRHGAQPAMPRRQEILQLPRHD